MEAMTEDRHARRRNRPTITVAEYINQQVGLCGKSQYDIAREAGFNKPNIISMIKQGKTKLPMSKIGPMAKALGVDALHLFRLVMQEYEPETWEAIQDTVLRQPLVTQNEMEIIEVIRASNVPNPKIRTDEERRALLDVVSTFRPENASIHD